MSADLTVHKYELSPGTITLDLPDGAEVLTVHAQSGGIFLWPRVQAHPPRRLRHRLFTTVGTGHPAPHGRYVGTAFLAGLVFHTFEVTL